jgi:hypothetical protein
MGVIGIPVKGSSPPENNLNLTFWQYELKSFLTAARAFLLLAISGLRLVIR